MCPAFSADGEHLAYGEGLETSATTLGSEQRAIVVAALGPDGSLADPALRLPVAGAGPVPCAIWSPDGTRLAYVDGDAIAVISEGVVMVKTLRRRLLAIPGRLTRSGRRLTLHLPRRWPWAEAFALALARLRVIPLAA